ncbi:hypothetical protein GUJ93_ZPchr0012g19335 [Zizania palustris]|uniref:Uncharacterized protein n=1 Tax=Zizania palustris TaxID=103762 RepID=A0A8J6BW63_ZIZPA|nr:hypothetical protein GUJ93_ZPchr0012g19335 [Zizania palustris]
MQWVTLEVPSWTACRVASAPFKKWWSETSQHFFNRRTKHFCLSLDPSFTNIDPEVGFSSHSSRPIDYGLPPDTTNLGSRGPTRSAWLARKRVKTPAFDAARIPNCRGVYCRRCSSLGTSMYTFIT